jgi:hypothetical protein
MKVQEEFVEVTNKILDITVFQEVTLCNLLERYQSIGGISSLHHQKTVISTVTGMRISHLN